MNVKKDIKIKLLEQCKNNDLLYSVVWLITYRSGCEGEERLLQDYYLNDGWLKRLCVGIYRRAVYYLSYFVLPSLKSNNPILCTHGFWSVGRYDELINEAQNSYDLIGVLDYRTFTSFSYLRKIRTKWREFTKQNMRLGYWGAASRTTRDLVKELYFGVNSGSFEKEQYSDAELVELLLKLEKSLKQDVDRITLAFNKYGIQKCISVNEYELDDIIIIHACKKSGIKTRYVAHGYVMGTGDINENSFDCFTCCDEYYLWSEREVEVVSNMVRFFPYVPQIRACGNIEVLRRDVEKYYVDDSSKTVVTFFVTPSEFVTIDYGGDVLGQEYDSCSEKAKKSVYKMWETQFLQFEKLKSKYGCRVLLRYHPFEKKEYMEMMKGLEDNIGLENRTGGKSELMSCCGKSSIAFASYSTALFVAEAFGCECINIGRNCDEKNRLAMEKLGIKTVDTCEISEIMWVENKGKPRYELMADIERVFGN